jgi:hypothetical protein
MPVAVVQEWLEEETDRSTTNYDALHERIIESGPIEGFLLHAAGFTGHGFRIFEVGRPASASTASSRSG